MKRSGKIRTLRGSFNTPSASSKRQLIVNDGRLNFGLKVLSFTVWNNFQSATAGCDATLSLEPIMNSTNIFDASDNRQIAWTVGGYDSSQQIAEWREVIDPNHIVNRDLFITLFASPNITWNYMVTCEEIELTDDESIITLIKEDLQGNQS